MKSYIGDITKKKFNICVHESKGNIILAEMHKGT